MGEKNNINVKIENHGVIPKEEEHATPEELYSRLIDKIKRYHPSAGDLKIIEKAYNMAREAHKEQKRKSGEPYIIHPLCTAIILADLELDKESIVAGLLHDVMEDTSVTKEQITKNIKSTGDYTKVKKGKIKKGDIVNIYYVGKVNGKTFEGGSLTKKTNKAGYDLEIGSNTFIDGFEDGLIGRKIGSKCKIKVTFPEQYSQNQDLAGKKAVFSVTINFKEVYPELSDKFVKKNMKDFDKDYENTAAGYTKYVRDNLLAEKAWSTFYDTCKVNDYPESKMKTMKTQLKTSITYYLQNNGYTLENYLKSQNSSMSDFNKQLETTAKTDVGKQLVYGAVAEKENITVSDKQYKEEVKTYLTNYNCKNEKELSSTFKDYYGVDAKTIITEDILYKNVKNFLIKNVKES